LKTHLTHHSPLRHSPTNRIRQPLAAFHPEQFSQSFSQRLRPTTFVQLANLVQALVQAFGINAFRPLIYGIIIGVRFRSGRRGRTFNCE
jgi:hypothetical protein